MTERARLPLFVREALEADAREAASSESDVRGGERDRHLVIDVERSFLALERALETSAVEESARADTAQELQRGLGRLQLSLSQPPHRYAPFYARAAELFDLSEDALIAELERLRDPGAWKFAGLPGISHVSVTGGPRVKAAETLFVRFKPGVYFPRHQHTGVERVLVLEGSYEDSHGLLHRPGELHEWAAGTDHSFRVGADEPCIFASVVFGRRFSAWPLRALASLLGR
jgi:anti-sigma factor ChrR (cupin superfamily)